MNSVFGSSISLTCFAIAFLVLVSSENLLQANDDPESEKAVPYADLAQDFATKFLAGWDEVPDDFACWMDAKVIQIVQRQNEPVDFHRAEIVAAGPGAENESSWVYHGYGEVPVREGLSTTRPLWDQRLRINQKPPLLCIRQATLSSPPGMTKYTIGREPTPPRAHRKWFHPFVMPFARHSNLLLGTCKEGWFTKIFLDKSLIKEVQWSDNREFLTASYVYGGERFPVICKVKFAKEFEWFPTEVDFRLKKTGVLISKIATRYQRVGNRWLPERVEQISVSASGKTHINSVTDFKWLVGDDFPDRYPNRKDGDWRLYFCKVFDKDCLDPRKEHAAMFDILRTVEDASTVETTEESGQSE